MSSLTARLLCVVGVVLLVGGVGSARGQERPPAATTPAAGATDPRVGLKPGLKDAGQAASNLELVSSLPKPAGFGRVRPDDWRATAGAAARGGSALRSAFMLRLGRVSLNSGSSRNDTSSSLRWP